MIETLKVLAFVAALGTATLSRRWSLALVAFLVPQPYLLPQSPIAGLNGLNILLMPTLMHAFLMGRAPGIRRRDPLVIPAAILLGWVLFSLVRVQLSLDHTAEFLQKSVLHEDVTRFKGMVMPFVLYFCARRLATDEKAIRFALIGALSGYVAQAVGGAVDALHGVRLTERATGYFASSGSMGHFLAPYTMLPAAVLLSRVRGLRIAAALAMAISIIGILGSLSRGALLAFGAGLTSMAVVKRSLWIVVIAALLFTSTAWLPEDYLARFSESVVRDRTGLSHVPGFTASDDLDLNNESRMRLWRAGLKMVADHPILGVGFNRFPDVLLQYAPTEKKMRAAHNVPLGLAAECGIPAALAHFAILLVLARFTLLLALTRRGPPRSTFGLGMFGATVAFALSGMVIPEFYGEVDSGLYFMLVGVVVNLCRVEEAERKAETKAADRPRTVGASTATAVR